MATWKLLKHSRNFTRIFNNVDRHALSTESGVSPVIVAVEEVRNFIKRCIAAAGAQPKHAAALADNLTVADYRGHYSHGLNRLGMYVKDLNNGTTSTEGEPKIAKETNSTALVDGCNLLGPVVGNVAMETAIKKARKSGVGWVVANGSNHFGIAGFYALQACKQGLLKAIGTNPISLAAPGLNGDSYVLDMATSAVALGKVELASVKGDAIPHGWGADKYGKESLEPQEVLGAGGLLPLGGPEISGGYKGYGLAMLVEIFCGVLTGSQIGRHIRHWKSEDEVANLGQCFIAVDPNAFGSGFETRLQSFMDDYRNLELAEGESEVLVPGDPERMHMALCDRRGGIAYHPNQIKILTELAMRLKVEPLQSCPSK